MYSTVQWFVSVLEKQHRDKAAGFMWGSSLAQPTPRPAGDAAQPGTGGARLCADWVPAPHLSRTWWSRGRRAISFQLWSWICCICRYLPMPVNLTSEREQIWHNLKRSFGEHTEHVQPGRLKMCKATQSPRNTQRWDRPGKTVCLGRKHPATSLWTAK